MVFKRLLASVGIGNASVDTVLSNPVLIPGDVLQGVITMRGGTVDQQIDRIDLSLETQADRESDDIEYKESVSLFRESISSQLSLKAGTVTELPFQIRIPYDTPINRALGFDLRIPISLRTHVHIAGAVDASDRDPVVVEPNPAQARILDAMRNLSCRLYKADLDFGHIPGSRLPFFQELEFYAGPNYARFINEIELTFVARENDMDVILEMDKKTSGLARMAYTSFDEVRGFRVSYHNYRDQDWESVIENLLMR
jgi:sporulation-control protein